MKWLVGGLGVLVVVGAAIWFGQRSLIFFPDRSDPGAAAELFPLPSAPAGEILTNARQADAVGAALASLTAAREAMEQGVTPDAVLTETEQAMSALAELSGRRVRDDVTDRIFARFCVGK